MKFISFDEISGIIAVVKGKIKEEYLRRHHCASCIRADASYLR